MQNDLKVPKVRLTHVDALRGLAAVAVLLQHTLESVVHYLPSNAVAGAWISAAVTRDFDLGRFGVVLFFLISGLVVPFSISGERPLRKFFISRFFRLYPAFWISMLVTVAVTIWRGGNHFTTREILANLTMVPGLVHQPYISGVYWTLFVELVFYGSCVGLFLIGGLGRASVNFAVGAACLAVPAAAVALRAHGTHVPVIYLTAHLAWLFTGCLIRMALLEGQRAARVQALALAAANLALMPFLAMQPEHSFTVSTPHGVFVAGLGAFALFTVVVARPVSVTRFWVWLGAISYSVYLLHIPAGNIGTSLVVPVDGFRSVAFLAITLALTVAAASWVYRYVEVPCIALGRRFVPARAKSTNP